MIQRRTRFSGRYYVLFLSMLILNFLAQSANGNVIFQAILLVIIIAFWFNMHLERNKMADRIDDIIMNAKSKQSMTHLVENAMNPAIENEESMQQESRF